MSNFLSPRITASGKFPSITVNVLTNSSGESGGGSVLSVNGQIGTVVLTAEDVGALPDSVTIPEVEVLSVNGKIGDVVLDAEDVGALPESTTIPEVEVLSVNGKIGEVVLTHEDVDALPSSTTIPEVEVLSVNGKIGEVVLTHEDVDALPSSTSIPDISNLVSNDDTRLSDSRTPSGSAGGVLSGSYPNPSFSGDVVLEEGLNSAISEHNEDSTAHPNLVVSSSTPFILIWDGDEYVPAFGDKDPLEGQPREFRGPEDPGSEEGGEWDLNNFLDEWIEVTL